MFIALTSNVRTHIAATWDWHQYSQVLSHQFSDDIMVLTPNTIQTTTKVLIRPYSKLKSCGKKIEIPEVPVKIRSKEIKYSVKKKHFY